MKAPRVAAVALAGGLTVLGCHTITELPTSSSSPSPSPSMQAIQIPITNVPTPPPTPTPAPTPTPPNPSPTPNPTPTPDSGGTVHVFCSPAIPPDGWPCPRSDTPAFVDVVATAILNLKRDQPSLFNDYLVLDKIAYYNGVFANLYNMGYCAAMDSEEVAVSTRDNKYYRENYQILSSMSKYRTGVNSHLAACQVPH
jgi:hypothetical protein